MKNYDVAIIGGGTAGLTAAAHSIQLGAKTVIIEKRKIGGDCTWFGCIPSKTLLKIASIAHEARMSKKYGLEMNVSEVNLAEVMEKIQETILNVYAEESPEKLKEEGIDVLFGSAKFLDSHRILVGDQEISANKILIATGASPYIQNIPGLNLVNYLTYENIWQLKKLPDHLIVLGGGAVGCELAQSFRRLGSNVTLIEQGTRLLPHEDKQASKVIAQVFEEDGVNLKLSTSPDSVWQDSSGIHLKLGEEEVVCDVLLVATGRKPNVSDLSMDKAGINFNEEGIFVDNYLRTSQKHIYVAGDCIGSYQFSHYAGWQAAMAIRNALLPGNSSGKSNNVPGTIFTDPEIAQIGLLEEEAREKFGKKCLVYERPMNNVDRARTEFNMHGFLKIIYHRNGTILGVTIVGARAGETINEWSLAMQKKMSVMELSNSIHVYPTFSILNMQASASIRMKQLLGGSMGKFLKGKVKR
ncbi:MAG: FAD-dependent oxidoreductase [Anaerolineaceae bacterium]|nr:FAD-dependent oxidoreductase [Anaerolineaceae bacterium]